jgi:hypothetical protein
MSSFLTVPARSLGHRIPRLAALAAVALAVLSITGATRPAPASAAAVTYTSFCLKHTNGSAWHETVYAQAYYAAGWTTIGTSTGGYYGCGAFWMPANTYVRVTGSLWVGRVFFSGATGYALTPRYGGGSVNLGTGWISSARI